MLDSGDLGRLIALAAAAGLLAGLLGTWVVLRGQAFLAHASGATAYAGATVGSAIGVAVLPAGLIAAALVAVVVGRASDRRPETAQVATGLALSCGLAIATVASAYGTPGGAAALLGSALLATDAEILTAVAIAVVAAVAAALLWRWWLLATVAGRGGAAWTGAPRAARFADAALLLLTGLAVAAMLPVGGALLAGTLLVVPVLTARRLAPRPAQLAPAAGALAFALLLAALVVAEATDLPPGASAALLAAGVDAVVAIAVAVARRRGPDRSLPAAAA